MVKGDPEGDFMYVYIAGRLGVVSQLEAGSRQ